MKLKKILVRGFRSIKETETLLIDDRITILIGANDHGKSNLLEAILRLNDDSAITEDDINWDSPDDQTPRIEWYFSVEDKDLASYKVQIETATSPSAKVSQETTSDTPPEQTEQKPELQCFDVNSNGEIVYFKDGVGTPLQIMSVPLRISKEHEAALVKLRPRIEPFLKPVATNLKDEVTAAELATPEFEFMQGIFHLAGLWEHKDVIFTQNDRTSKLLNKASNNLTKVLNDKWNQGRDLKWKLEHSGTNGDHIRILIEDPSVENQFTRPSLKSSGFQTFFVLSMMINARKYNNSANTFIFLFDEPGTYLHPYAQLDLQRSFEAVADSAQIVYTTHSLFLINKNHPKRNRVISKTKDGTKIDQKPFQKNWKAVRESLGILLSNNFLIAEKTLLVEGPSDIIYLLDVIKRLKKGDKVDIDLNDLSIVDAGTSENYVAMAKLMLSEGRDLVALVDGDGSGDNISQKLQKSCQKEIQDKHLKIHPLPTHKSIEDICCDIKILRIAIKKLTENLVSTNERELMDNLKVEDEVKKIKPSSSKSLGLVISENTKHWFKEKEKLSKLSIAMIYEELAENESLPVNSTEQELIEKIKQFMNLKGEKSADKGVFEEIKN